MLNAVKLLETSCLGGVALCINLHINLWPGSCQAIHYRVDLIVLFYTDSLNKTRSLFYIKVREAKKALIKDIGPVNRVHLTVLVSVETSISCVSRNYVAES